MDPDTLPTRRDVAEAAGRIAGHVRRTPVLALDDTTVLKLELAQHTGSFKPRGAFNDVLGLPGLPAAGIVAASGGNHGQAVAFVAGRLGVPAEVFVPEVCPEVKRRRIAALGARVVVGGAVYDDAQAACSARAAQTGAHLVHPFDAATIVAGAGTVAAELQADAADLDTVLVAVGGGGLMAGALAWYGRDVRVVAVEPDRSCALRAALDHGAPCEVTVEGVAADSLGARRVGELAFGLARRDLAAAVTVPDAAIVEAQHRLWELARVAAEPGGATAYAALVSGAYRPAPGERVGVIVCGGNVDPATLSPGDPHGTSR
jgi:threonine dehydratase